jgi:HEAT repeat protein
MGQEGAAWSVIAGLLRSDDDATRLAAVEGCAEVRAPESTGELVRILKAGPRPLQLAAIRSLRASRDPDSLVAVLQTLSDPDPALRHAAGDALAGWDGAAESLMAILTNGPEAAQDEAVRALRGAGDPARGRVLTWAEGRLHEAVQLRGSSDSLKTFCVADSDAAYLIELLQRDETRQEGRVLGALESVESPGSMRVVARALRARDRDLNSQALEALETLGDRNLTQGLIRLMEPVGPSASGGSGEATLRGLAAHGRAWYRILAFRVLARQAADPAAIRRQVARDSDPLVRSCLAGGRAETVGGEMIETSPTLSTVQRVLFLKDVPLFRLLEPEDLERIAAIAQERLYDPRETICREGEVGDEMHILVEGRVEISKLVEGQAHMLRRLEAGEHLGELAILREQPRSASVVCITRVRSLVLSGEALRSILQDRPAVGLAMLESLADRMSTLG